MVQQERKGMIWIGDSNIVGDYRGYLRRTLRYEELLKHPVVGCLHQEIDVRLKHEITSFVVFKHLLYIYRLIYIYISNYVSISIHIIIITLPYPRHACGSWRLQGATSRIGLDSQWWCSLQESPCTDGPFATRMLHVVSHPTCVNMN
jgi:hypothetical protein